MLTILYLDCLSLYCSHFMISICADWRWLSRESEEPDRRCDCQEPVSLPVGWLSTWPVVWIVHDHGCVHLLDAVHIFLGLSPAMLVVNANTFLQLSGIIRTCMYHRTAFNCDNQMQIFFESRKNYKHNLFVIGYVLCHSGSIAIIKYSIHLLNPKSQYFYTGPTVYEYHHSDCWHVQRHVCAYS